MLGTRLLPALVSSLLLGLTLGCDPLSLEPPDTSAAPPIPTGENADPLSIEPPDSSVAPSIPTVESSDPPSLEPPGACAALEGSRFRSVEFHEVGPSVHGIQTLGRWHITFGDGEFDWVHGQTEESGSYTCAGLDVKGLTKEGREISGTYDPLTGRLSWDGVVYLNESDAANVDACAVIDGNGFSGLEASEAGNGPEGISYGRAGISFEGGDFHWSYSDVQETGSTTCADGRIIATRVDGSVILGFYDPVMGTLTWEGARYGDPREFPDADP